MQRITVSIGIHCNRGYSHFFGGGKHATGYFTTIGY
jgi:hypothetical protein